MLLEFPGRGINNRYLPYGYSLILLLEAVHPDIYFDIDCLYWQTEVSPTNFENNLYLLL